MESCIAFSHTAGKTSGLSWNLDHDRATPDIMTPFRYLTSPLPPCLQPSQSDFHQFSLLPQELQDHVAQNADVATAWQLMRTTSSMRKIAKTIFWENEDIYYHVCTSWWLSRGQGYKCTYDFQMDFWAEVSSIRIDPERYERIFKTGNVWDNGVRGIDDQISWFWSEISKSFPSIKRVMLENYEIRNPPLEDDADWAILRKILNMAPKHVEVRIVLNGGFYRYNISHSNPPSPVGSNRWPDWRLLNQTEWHPGKIISAPGVWKMPESLVKEYEQMKHILAILLQETRGYERLCEVSPGATSLSLSHAFLQAKQDRIHYLEMQYRKRWLKIRTDMGDYDSADRKEYEQRLKVELKRYMFPNYELRTRNEVCYFREYIHGGFWMHFDPTHVYYSPAIGGYDDNPYSQQDETTATYEAEKDSDNSSSTPLLDLEML